MNQPSFICNGCGRQFNGVPIIILRPTSSETFPGIPFGMDLDWCSTACLKAWFAEFPDKTAKGLVEVAPVLNITVDNVKASEVSAV